jgi:hypothetical protein
MQPTRPSGRKRQPQDWSRSATTDSGWRRLSGRKKKLLVTAGVLFAILALGRGLSLALTSPSPTPQVVPTVARVAPPTLPRDVFRQPAYTSGRGFTPDAIRILDIGTMRIALAKFRALSGKYPRSLRDLYPEYPPKSSNESQDRLPTDPERHTPYSYSVSHDGSDYRLSAMLSTGQAWTLTGESHSEWGG